MEMRIAELVTAANAGWAPHFRVRGLCDWPGVAEFRC
jgi:hypothetical protein